MKIKLTNFELYGDSLNNLISKSLDNLSDEVVFDLKSTAPADDTTKEKAKYIYNKTGKRAWIKDDVESRLYWQKENNKNRGRNKVIQELTNENPAVIALALGFISPLNKNAEPVERTPDGKFSEQDPKGEYAINSIRRAMNKNGFYDIK